MGIYAEFLILYVIIFFSGSASAFAFTAQTAEGFSVFSEILKILLYSVPSLALIWHLLLKIKPLRLWDVSPDIKDFISGLITLPCLLIIGFVTAYVSSYVNIATGAAVDTGGASAPILHTPSGGAGWAVLCASCVISAYLEESFFRFYILTRRREMNLRAPAALLISVSLFSICHIYEGPWGFLNAVLSGAFLCMIFIRYKAFHGIAIAHGMYNIAVYVISAYTG
jgi:membrane protease YdiL (CAAX protease family)